MAYIAFLTTFILSLGTVPLIISLAHTSGAIASPDRFGRKVFDLCEQLIQK